MSRASTGAAGSALRAASATAPSSPAAPSPSASAALSASSTDEAMDRFAAGELAAFREVYAAARPRIERTLGRLTRQRAAAEDLAQETMLRIYCARGSWRPGGRVLPWANAIARRLFIDRVRSYRREQRLYDALAHGEAQRSDAPRADAHLAARRKAAALTASVEHLPPTQREALQLVALDGKSLAEASAQLGETNVTVRVRLHRARTALASALAEH